MASSQTKNYKLSQWAASDRILRGDFNSDNSKIDTALAAKAEASALTALQTTVNGKADAAALTALQTTVKGKADASTLTALQKTVNGKADATALTALQKTVSGKADASSLTSLQSTVNTLSAALGSGGKNCRVTTGSYTGTGLYDSKNALTITTPFYPVLVAIMGVGSNIPYGSSPVMFLLRPAAAIPSQPLTVVQWKNNGVSWYATNYPENMSNHPNATFYYVALGYDL